MGPALVALVTHIFTNEPMSLHRTWITDTGKADVHPQRAQLFGHSLENGVIKLWHDWCLGERLGLAEGLETALSLAHCVQPSWACMDAGHLAKFPVLPYVRELYISQDNDPAGIAAAECARRWTDSGAKVFVTQQQKNDLNDEVTSND